MGGIERSLLSLLNKFPANRFDVTIFVMKLGGELLDQLPKGVKVKCIFGHEKTMLKKLINYVKSGEIMNAVKTFFYTLLMKRGGPKSSIDQNMYYSKMLPQEKFEYDLAIAYYIPTSLSVVYVMNNL